MGISSTSQEQREEGEGERRKPDQYMVDTAAVRGRGQDGLPFGLMLPARHFNLSSSLPCSRITHSFVRISTRPFCCTLCVYGECSSQNAVAKRWVYVCSRKKSLSLSLPDALRKEHQQ